MIVQSTVLLWELCSVLHPTYRGRWQITLSIAIKLWALLKVPLGGAASV